MIIEKKGKLVFYVKKIVSILVLTLASLLSLNYTLAYYTTSSNIVNTFSSEDYTIKINTSGGYFNVQNIQVNNNRATLPSPLKRGYNFLGFSKAENEEAIYSVSIDNIEEVNKQTLYAKWDTVIYNINYNLNGGSISSQPTAYNVEQTLTLPQPTKVGHTFTGWTGTGLNSATKDVTIKDETGNRNYTANWSKNTYIVNYYINGSLWTQRTVGYNDMVENLNAQGLLDNYHTFHGWTGWVDKMPDHNINLYANITESFCQLTTGHGPWGNAAALLNVFNSAGWTGTIIEAPTAKGNYMVITDYNLTRAEAEIQKNYIASHTNYNNYNYPYLYWVSVVCSNGYSEAWTRPRGQSWFN